MENTLAETIIGVGAAALGYFYRAAKASGRSSERSVAFEDRLGKVEREVTEISRSLPKDFMPRPEIERGLQNIDQNISRFHELLQAFIHNGGDPGLTLRAIEAAAAIDLAAAVLDKRVVAFLRVIRFSEGTSSDPLTRCDGYDVIVSGPEGPEIFTDFSHHPFAGGRGPKLVRAATPGKLALYSTAAGAYQLLARYWVPYCKIVGASDFSAHTQDLIACRQLEERGALAMILAGDPASAIKAASSIWASFPDNTYGQGGHTAATLLQKYNEFLAEVSA